MSAGFKLDAPIGLSRYLPPEAVAQTARAYQASGVIDGVSVWDQLTFFHPRSMWEPKDVPMAGVIPDVESFPDPFTMLAYAVCAAPGLAVSVGTDSVRRSPAELLQTMLTLGDLSGQPATLQLGAGELKQCRPFGWKRSEGLRRMEDHLRAYRAILSTEGPADFQGQHWIYDQAWIGGARRHEPRVWCLGGGPKLLELAATYADGFSTSAPGVAYSAERMAEIMSGLRERVAAHDRDPAAFAFAVYPCTVLIHEDENVIDRALESRFLRWMTACWGRFNQEEWLLEGIDPPRPDWHYALKLLPMKVSDAERDEVLGRVTRGMSEKTWIYGTAEQVAQKLQPYIDAGVDWLHIADVLPFATDPDDAQNTVARTIEVALHLKQHAESTTGAIPPT
jgi:phthiodiolone/phenolphthiodiolone dimycocerosates ketoreductase